MWFLRKLQRKYAWDRWTDRDKTKWGYKKRCVVYVFMRKLESANMYRGLRSIKANIGHNIIGFRIIKKISL